MDDVVGSLGWTAAAFEPRSKTRPPSKEAKLRSLAEALRGLARDTVDGRQEAGGCTTACPDGSLTMCRVRLKCRRTSCWVGFQVPTMKIGESTVQPGDSTGAVQAMMKKSAERP